jgi:hypothetical protein
MQVNAETVECDEVHPQESSSALSRRCYRNIKQIRTEPLPHGLAYEALAK